MSRHPVLVDGRGYEADLTDPQIVTAELDRLDAAARVAGQPMMVTIFADGDDEESPTLAVGVGADESLLVFDSPEGDGGFSAGSRTGNTTIVSFQYGTTVNEYLAWMLIPRPDAWAAAREFARTGYRPTNINWGDI